MSASPETLGRVKCRVDAVVSRLRIPADSLVGFQPGDLIDIEPEASGELILQLSINGLIIAVAAVSEIDGRLVGTIIERNSDFKLRRVDQWKLRKP